GSHSTSPRLDSIVGGRVKASAPRRMISRVPKRSSPILDLLSAIPRRNHRLFSRRRDSMRSERWISRVAVVSFGLLLAITVGSRVVHGQAEHVRWDIVS